MPNDLQTRLENITSEIHLSRFSFYENGVTRIPVSLMMCHTLSSHRNFLEYKARIERCEEEYGIDNDSSNIRHWYTIEIEIAKQTTKFKALFYPCECIGKYSSASGVCTPFACSLAHACREYRLDNNVLERIFFDMGVDI